MDKDERKAWLKDEEASHNYDMATLGAVAAVFYFEAKRCYWAGAYFATCAMVGVAVEGFLRNATRAPPFAYPDAMITEVKRKKVISHKLAKRLRDMKDTIRNTLIHDPEETLWGSLGLRWRKSGTGVDAKKIWKSAPTHWLEPGDFEEAAERCLDTFLCLSAEVASRRGLAST